MILSVKVLIGLFLMLVALAGGALGTWNNIRNAQGPRERTFAIRVSIGCWLFVAALLMAISVTDGRLRLYVLIAFFILCPVLLYKWSNTQQLIRRLDQREHEDDGHEDHGHGKPHAA
jgi:Ca2+/Na+ antiporter